MKEKLFSFSLHRKLKEQLKELARNEGLSMATYIKRTIAKNYRELTERKTA